VVTEDVVSAAFAAVRKRGIVVLTGSRDRRRRP